MKFSGRMSGILVLLWLAAFRVAGAGPVPLHRALFNSARQATNLNETGQLGRKACQAAVASRDYESAAYYNLELGNIFFRKGSYVKAISLGRSGVQVLDRYKVRNDTLRFNHLSLLAALYSRLPMADSAQYWFTQSANWLKSNPAVAQTIPDEVCGHYMNMGMFYGLTGDAQRADKYLQEALPISRLSRDPNLEAIVYNYMGNSAFMLRDYKKANQYYRKSLKGYTPGTAYAYWGEIVLGNNLRAMGRPEDGVVYIQKGREGYFKIVRRDPGQYDNDFEIQSASYLAECLSMLKRYDAAALAFRTCIDLHKISGRYQGEFIAFSRIGLARIARAQGRLDEAVKEADSAVNASVYTRGGYRAEKFPAIVSEKTLYQSLLIRAEVNHERWKKTENQQFLIAAVENYREVLLAAARYRRNMIPEESKHFHVEQVAKSTDTAVELCFELYQKTNANKWKNLLFDFIEENRSMVVSDLLHEKYRVVKEVPGTVLERERALRVRKIEWNKLLAARPARAAADSISKLLSALDLETIGFLDSLENTFGRYYALKYDFNELSLPVLMERLPAKSAYISYFLHKKYIFCIAADKREAKVYRVPLPEQFGQLVSQFRQSLDADPDMFEFSGHRQSKAIYNLLVSPLGLENKGYERLVVARDGLLHYLPFEALEKPGGRSAFLGRHYAISYSYSAKLSFVNQKVYQNAPRITGFAPFVGENLPPGRRLISSLSEITAWAGRHFTDSAAVKNKLYQYLPETDILVLATHAFADLARPEHSQVAFYPGSRDSLLLATEIANMPLDHLRMVVLSACEGNEGSLNKAEGMLSLARAFRIAGCPTIVTTSWKAQSESISEFSKRFHGFLAEGMPADVALLKTRQQFFTDKDLFQWAHPFYWANFSLIGNPATIYPDHSGQIAWVLTLIAGLAICGVVVVSRRRVRGHLSARGV